MAGTRSSALLLAAVLLLVGCSRQPATEAETDFGPPRQEPTPATDIVLDDGTQLLPQASYRLRAVVLGSERYRFDRMADIVPYDLVLAWGPLAAPERRVGLSVSQGTRWYHFRTEGEAAPDPALVAAHSANVHIVPATPAVRRLVGRLAAEDLVEMEGLLVNVRRADGFAIDTSLSRLDRGAGACEVFYVTGIVNIGTGQRAGTPLL
jgi:hypothetical protein